MIAMKTPKASVTYRLRHDRGDAWRTHNTGLFQDCLRRKKNEQPLMHFGKAGILRIDIDKLGTFSSFQEMRTQLYVDGQKPFTSASGRIYLLIQTRYRRIDKLTQKQIGKLVRLYIDAKYWDCIDFTKTACTTGYVSAASYELVKEALGGNMAVNYAFTSEFKFRLPQTTGTSYQKMIALLESLSRLQFKEMDLPLSVLGRSLGISMQRAGILRKRAVAEGYLIITNRLAIVGVKGHTFKAGPRLKAWDGQGKQHKDNNPASPLFNETGSSLVYASNRIASGCWHATLLRVSQSQMSNKQFTSWFEGIHGKELKDRGLQFKALLASRRLGNGLPMATQTQHRPNTAPKRRKVPIKAATQPKHSLDDYSKVLAYIRMYPFCESILRQRYALEGYSAIRYIMAAGYRRPQERVLFRV